MKKSASVSRRRWISSSLATCGFLASGGLGLAQAADQPPIKGYTLPGPVTARGLAPGLPSRLISESPGGEKTYAVVFAKGDEVLSGLTEFAAREKLTSGYFTAIGALQHARFGWFDRTRKAYKHIPIEEQVELISLIGNVALVNGTPQIHAHGAVGFPDGSDGVLTDIATRVSKHFEASVNVTGGTGQFSPHWTNASAPAEQCSATPGNRVGKLSCQSCAGAASPRHSPKPIRAKPMRSHRPRRITVSPSSRCERLSGLASC